MPDHANTGYARQQTGVPPSDGAGMASNHDSRGLAPREDMLEDVPGHDRVETKRLLVPIED